MAVAFDNATSAQGNPLTSQSFALPTIAAGETIGLLVSFQPTGAVTISGAGTWTHQGTDSVIAGQLQLGFWTAFSTAGAESGQNVTINVAAQEKFSAIAFSLSGVDSTTPLLSGPTYAQNTTSNTTSATSPSVSPSPASWVATGYASKSSTNASYTTPAGLTSRQQVFGSGAGACDLALFDTNAAVSSGGNQTSTLGTATANKIAFTIVFKTAITTIALAESGIGTDHLTANAAVPLSDSGTGADRLAVSVPITLSDAGTAADRLTVASTIPLSDAGVGVDRSAVTATVPLSDHGAAADTLTTGIAITLADHGSGVDRLSEAVVLTLSDSGAGVDGLSRPRYPHGETFAAAVASGRTFATAVSSGQTQALVVNSGQTTAEDGASGRTTATSQ